LVAPTWFLCESAVLERGIEVRHQVVGSDAVAAVQVNDDQIADEVAPRDLGRVRD